jgi:hemerythrin superfamily protein
MWEASETRAFRALDSMETPMTNDNDVVTLIKAQHREMERLLDQAAQENADTFALLRQVHELLIPHSEAEESFV